MLLVNRVLDAIQAGSEVNPPQIKACSVVQGVREVYEHLDPRDKRDYRLHLDIPEHLTVWADQQCRREVLRNLLANAFKYCPKQPPLLIRPTPRKPRACETDPPTEL